MLKKLNFSTTLLVIFIFTNIKAQEVVKDTTKHNFYYEQGINCTQFVKQYLTFNESFTSNMPYLITGNIGFKRIGLRYGINYQISESDNNTSGSSSSSSGGSSIAPPTVNQSNSVAFDNRVGFYYRKSYFKRLNLNIGIDYLIGSSVIKTKSENTQTGSIFTTLTKSETRTSTKSSGYGVSLAINYKIWKSISIGTEAALYYISGTSRIEGSSFVSETPIIPFSTYSYLSQEIKGKTTFNDTQIRVPMTLYIYVKL
jgi:hypothetical protein